MTTAEQVWDAFLEAGWRFVTNTLQLLGGHKVTDDEWRWTVFEKRIGQAQPTRDFVDAVLALGRLEDATTYRDADHAQQEILFQANGMVRYLGRLFHEADAIGRGVYNDVVGGFLREAIAPTASVKAMARLGNVELTSAPLDLCGGQQVSMSTISDWVNMEFGRHEAAPEDSQVVGPAFVRLSTRPKREVTLAEWYEDETRFASRRLILAMRFLGGLPYVDRTAISFISDCPARIQTTDRLVGWPDLARPFVGDAFSLKLNRRNVARLAGMLALVEEESSEIWPAFGQEPGTSGAQTRIEIATAALESCHTRMRWEEALVDACTALETLYGPFEREEIVYKLKTRVAMVLGATESRRMEICEAVEALYALRSAIVHGRPLSRREQQRRAKQTRRLALLVRPPPKAPPFALSYHAAHAAATLVARSILAFLRLGRDRSDIDWDRALFSRTYQKDLRGASAAAV